LGFEVGQNWGPSRVELKHEKRPFRVVVTTVETLNMKSHSNGKNVSNPLEMFNLDYSLEIG